ncbi:unnamed protein product [Urochloa decumbens]|uniref:Uncharacterized protein n=1 Tax=Urochloa decumbens TaxID=240449 RepID=A0ABC9BSW4_9POAL
MKSVGKQAAEFLRKTAGALRGKAAVLRARLLFLASPRRRMAVVAGISRQIRALTPRQDKAAAAQCRCTAVAPPVAEGDGDGDGSVVGLPELARLFEQVAADEGGEYPDDWALTLRSLFDDESNKRRSDDGGGFAVVDEDDDEPSVMDVIRSRREGDGVEFRMEQEIDEAADMYIARVRRRIIMNYANTELKLSTL